MIAETDEPVALDVSSHTATVRIGDVSLSVKLIEGRFPEISRVIPKDAPIEAIIPKAEFSAAIGRAGLVENATTRQIALQLYSKSMTVSAQNAEEESEELVDITFSRDAPLVVGFNADYLADALSHVDSNDVRALFTEDERHCLIHDMSDDRFRFLVMPMRL